MPIFVSFVVIGFVSSFGPTSAWRLFDRETTNAVNDVSSENGSIKEDYVLTGGNFFKEGTVIDIPPKQTALNSFAVYDYLVPKILMLNCENFVHSVICFCAESCTNEVDSVKIL